MLFISFALRSLYLWLMVQFCAKLNYILFEKRLKLPQRISPTSPINYVSVSRLSHFFPYKFWFSYHSCIIYYFKRILVILFCFFIFFKKRIMQNVTAVKCKMLNNFFWFFFFWFLLICCKAASLFLPIIIITRQQNHHRTANQ